MDWLPDFVIDWLTEIVGDRVIVIDCVIVTEGLCEPENVRVSEGLSDPLMLWDTEKERVAVMH